MEGFLFVALSQLGCPPRKGINSRRRRTGSQKTAGNCGIYKKVFAKNRYKNIPVIKREFRN